MCRRKDYENNKRLIPALKEDQTNQVHQFKWHTTDEKLRDAMLETKHNIKVLQRRIHQYEEYIL